MRSENENSHREEYETRAKAQPAQPLGLSHQPRPFRPPPRQARFVFCSRLSQAFSLTESGLHLARKGKEHSGRP